MSFTELSEILAVGQVVEVEGSCQVYQGEPQVNVSRLRAIPTDSVDPAEFLPVTAKSLDDLLVQFEEKIDALSAPWREVITRSIGLDLPRFARWPAAKMYHHAWVGGLMEHTLEVVQIARGIARFWPTIDLDLLVAGALLHDIGKLDEFDVSTTFSYSDSGSTLGHIVSGLMRVGRACDEIGQDEFDAQRLLHCIASHHGKREYGAAVEPVISEAIILNKADELSADLAMIAQAVAEDGNQTRDWSERVPGLGRPIWLRAARAAQSSRETEMLF